MKEFTELDKGDQGRVMKQIMEQREAGTLFIAKRSKAVNFKGVAPFKTIDKNGNKIAKGDRCTFWYNQKANIARLYAITKVEKAPVKAEKAPVTTQPKVAMGDLAKMTKKQLLQLIAATA